MAVNWNYYNRFEELTNKYMPRQGEGETIGSQMVTAVNKLVYKWYNDGDVYDNTYVMQGWCNDLSSYANWLHKYAPRTADILEGIYTCYTGDEYEDILRELTDLVLDERYLSRWRGCEKVGSIYDCDGPFRFEEYSDEDEWDDEYDEYDEEEDF